MSILLDRLQTYKGPARPAPAFETTGKRHELAAFEDEKSSFSKCRFSGDVAGEAAKKQRVWRISLVQAPHLIAETIWKEFVWKCKKLGDDLYAR